MPAPKAYKSILYQLMSFLDGVTYSPSDNTISFLMERLASIIVDDIVYYFNFKAYGTPEPSINNLSKRCHSCTLLYQNEAIFYFLHRQNMQWENLAYWGNPTKLMAVNKVIVDIKMHEVQGIGDTCHVFLSKPNTMIWLLAILTLQWLFTARIENCMQLATITMLLHCSCCTSRWYCPKTYYACCNESAYLLSFESCCHD